MRHQALTPLIYDELRALARRQLRGDPLSSSLQPTELVHEAFVRLERSGIATPEDRTQILALASTLMRNLLVDRARRRRAVKRGGDRIRVPLRDDIATMENSPMIDVIALDAALTRLEARDPRSAQIVQLRYFGGLSELEIADELGVSDRWVRKLWAHARAWLHRELDDDGMIC